MTHANFLKGVLRFAYLGTAVVLVLLVVMFVLVVSKHIGVCSSIKGYFVQTPRQIRRGANYIALWIAGVAMLAVVLFFLGYCRIANIIAILLPCVLIPTVFGLSAATLGVLVGLYGPLAGLFLYALSAGGMQYYWQNSWLWSIVNLSAVVAGWCAGAIVIGQQRYEVCVSVFLVRAQSVDQIARQVVETFERAAILAYQGALHVTPKVSRRKGAVTVFRLESEGTVDFEHRLLVCAGVNRFKEAIRSLFVGHETLYPYQNASQALDAFANIHAWIEMRIVITTRHRQTSRESHAVVITSFQTPTFVLCPEKVLGLHKRMCELLTGQTAGNACEIEPFNGSPIRVNFLHELKRPSDYLVRSYWDFSLSAEQRVNLSDRFAPISDLVQECLAADTLVGKLRQRAGVEFAVAIANTLASIGIGLVLRTLGVTF